MIKFGISTLILIFTMFSSFPLFAGLSDDNKGVSNPKTATITSSGGDIEIAVEKTDLQPNEFRGSFVLSYTLSDQKGREIESDFFRVDVEEYAVSVGLSNESLRVIVDPFTASITTLFDDKVNKIGTVRPMPPLPRMSYETQSSRSALPSPFGVNVTDEYKEIEGFTCRKHIITYNDMLAESWIATEESLSLEKIISYLKLIGEESESGDDVAIIHGGIRGLVLESTVTYANGNVGHVTISNLAIGDVDLSKFSTSGYTIHRIGGNPEGTR